MPTAVMDRESMNAAMRNLRANGVSELAARAVLDAGVAEYVDRGLVLESDGTLASSAARADGGTGPSRFEDKTSYECFVNKIYIDDWASPKAPTADLGWQLTQAVLLSRRVAEQAAALGQAVVVLIGCQPDTGEVVFRFHVRRDDEQPWLEDVDDFEEPVLAQSYRLASA